MDLDRDRLNIHVGSHVPKACDPASRATLLAAAEPFVAWLQEAAEDDPEEE